MRSKGQSVQVRACNRDSTEERTRSDVVSAGATVPSSSDEPSSLLEGYCRDDRVSKRIGRACRVNTNRVVVKLEERLARRGHTGEGASKYTNFIETFCGLYSWNQAFSFW